MKDNDNFPEVLFCTLHIYSFSNLPLLAREALLLLSIKISIFCIPKIVNIKIVYILYSNAN